MLMEPGWVDIPVEEAGPGRRGVKIFAVETGRRRGNSHIKFPRAPSKFFGVGVDGGFGAGLVMGC